MVLLITVSAFVAFYWNLKDKHNKNVVIKSNTTIDSTGVSSSALVSRRRSSRSLWLCYYCCSWKWCRPRLCLCCSQLRRTLTFWRRYRLAVERRNNSNNSESNSTNTMRMRMKMRMCCFSLLSPLLTRTFSSIRSTTSSRPSPWVTTRTILSCSRIRSCLCLCCLVSVLPLTF